MDAFAALSVSYGKGIAGPTMKAMQSQVCDLDSNMLCRPLYGAATNGLRYYSEPERLLDGLRHQYQKKGVSI